MPSTEVLSYVFLSVIFCTLYLGNKTRTTMVDKIPWDTSVIVLIFDVFKTEF